VHGLLRLWAAVRIDVGSVKIWIETAPASRPFLKERLFWIIGKADRPFPGRGLAARAESGERAS
jgi:hypothetical protein